MVRPIRTSVIAAMTCAVLMLPQGWIAIAAAADWPTWPRPSATPMENAPKPATPPPAPAPTPKATAPASQAPAPESAPPASEAAAKAGEERGKKAAGWIKTGTVTKAALVAAGIVVIAIAIGGGSSSSNH